MARMTSYKWTFAARFRRGAFGWKSALPIQRLKEAVTEIRQVARREPALAAEGAVSLLEKLSPALGDVLDAYSALADAALASGMKRDELNGHLRDQFARGPGNTFVATVLAHHMLPECRNASG